jgi:hypothetical protein
LFAGNLSGFNPPNWARIRQIGNGHFFYSKKWLRYEPDRAALRVLEFQ